MTSGMDRLFLIIALLALLAGAFAASACGGGSKNKSTPVPAATSAATTPKATTQAAATPKATQAAATPKTTPTPGSASVEAKNFAFNPKTVTIKVGDTVTWTNQDSTTHTVTGDGGIDSGNLAPGKTYSKTFDTAGTFNYHCSIHPSMTGQVIVQ